MRGSDINDMRTLSLVSRGLSHRVLQLHICVSTGYRVTVMAKLGAWGDWWPGGDRQNCGK